MKRFKLIQLLIIMATVLTVAFPCVIMAEVTGQEVGLEWTYDDVPVEGRTLQGFHLYKEGEKVCTFDVPNARVGSCQFNSEPGMYGFTLTAYCSDGFESKASPIYNFELKEGKSPVLIHIIGRQVSILIEDSVILE